MSFLDNWVGLSVGYWGFEGCFEGGSGSLIVYQPAVDVIGGFEGCFFMISLVV